MAERKNIWGKSGCELPSGDLCNACCNVKAIDSQWGQKRFTKLPHTSCEFMSGSGCKIYQFAPNGCEAYHCGNDVPAVKILLIEYAQRAGLVTPDQAKEAKKKI